MNYPDDKTMTLTSFGKINKPSKNQTRRQKVVMSSKVIDL